MTTTKAALSFADQIKRLEDALKKCLSIEHDHSDDDLFYDYQSDLAECIQQWIQYLKDWPVDLISSKLVKDSSGLIEGFEYQLAVNGCFYAFSRIDSMVRIVLPLISAGDGLEVRLEMAKDLALEVNGYDFSACQAWEFARHGLSFGLEIKDQRKWNQQLSEMVDKTIADCQEESALIKRYRDATDSEAYNRKKLGIDPDAELTKELLLDHLNAMKEAKPDAHYNTVRSWKNAAESLYVLVVYTDAPEEEEENSNNN